MSTWLEMWGGGHKEGGVQGNLPSGASASYESQVMGTGSVTPRWGWRRQRETGCHLVSDVLGGSGMSVGDKVEREEVGDRTCPNAPGEGGADEEKLEERRQRVRVIPAEQASRGRVVVERLWGGTGETVGSKPTPKWALPRDDHPPHLRGGSATSASWGSCPGPLGASSRGPLTCSQFLPVFPQQPSPGSTGTSHMIPTSL